MSMALPILKAAQWLLNQAGGKLLNTVIDDLAVKMGLKPPPFNKSEARDLLNDYSQRLADVSRQVINRLDQDRIAKLKSAIDQLKRSSKTVSKQGTLQDALNKFSEITNLPEQGQTGGFPNAQLRSIAFLGIAAVHMELQDAKTVIAENIAAAVYADSSTAEQWLGKEIVRRLLTSAPLNQDKRPLSSAFETTVGLAAASLEAHHVECFYRGPDNHLKHRWWWSGSHWTDEQDLGGILTSAPAAISRRPNHVECFYRGQDNHIWHRWWEGSDWKREYRFEHSVSTSAPAASSLGPDHVECFYRGQDNHLKHRWWWNGWNHWSSEDDLGGTLTSAPTAVSWGPNRTDCFYRGLNNCLKHRWWNGSSWSHEEDLGGTLTSAPSVTSLGPNHLDCFYRGPDNHLKHRWWNGSSWSYEDDLGGVLTSAPAAISRKSNHIECFYRGQDNQIWHRWWDKSFWDREYWLGGLAT